MTHSTLLHAKLQKNLNPDAKGFGQTFLDFSVVTGFIIDNKLVVNENGVLSGTGNYLILHWQLLDFALAIT